MIDDNSDIFDMIRTKKRKPVPKGRAKAGKSAEEKGECQWQGCDKEGGYKAPHRTETSSYHNFCLEHVRQYNKNYNYFRDKSAGGLAEEPDQAQANQQGGVFHHRSSMSNLDRRYIEQARANGSFEEIVADPVKAQVRPRRLRGRKLSSSELMALGLLGLGSKATAEEIRRGFKEMAKSLHPDLNNGDRSQENKLREVIKSYELLKKNGLCT